MLEIFAADKRLTIHDVHVNATTDEVVVQIAGSRFTTPLASATPDQLRQDASVAAECAAAWHRMCAALNAEADRRNAEQRAAVDQAVRQAAGPAPADHADEATPTPPTEDPAAGPRTDGPTALPDAEPANGHHATAAVTAVDPVPLPAETTNGERAADIAELLGGPDRPPADPAEEVTS